MTPGSERQWAPGSVYYAGYTRAEAAQSVGPGWAVLAGQAWDAATRRGCVVVQVKQKFGTLTVYIRAPDSAVWDAVQREIARIARESMRTCEACGAPGRHWDADAIAELEQSLGRRVGAWWLTLCDRCAWRHYREDARGWAEIRGEWEPDDNDDGDDDEEVWR